MQPVRRRAIKTIWLCLCAMLLFAGAAPVGSGSGTGGADLAGGGDAGVPLREKYTYGGNSSYLDEYSRFLKYPYYSAIAQQYEQRGFRPAKTPAVVRTADRTATADGIGRGLERGVGGKSEPVFVWEDDAEWAEWEFAVVAEGLYHVEVEYFMLPGSGNPAVRSLTLNGETPFLEASNIVFPRKWRDEGEPVVNSLGDETRPGQIELPAWSSMRLADDSGLYAEPFRFYLQPGRTTVRLEYIDQTMAIARVSLVPADIVPSYSEVEERYRQNGYREAAASVQFEAELHAAEKSDPTLRRGSDGDPLVSPPSFVNRKLNVMGGWSWRRGNQAVTWEFVVPEDGLYKIAVRYLQTWNDGLPSYRQIAVDGQVPFRELLAYRFAYDKQWRLETLSDEEGSPYLFYLSAGTHRLTMTVKLGPIAPVLHSLTEDSLLLSNMIRDIVKITGSQPDPNYDYEFFTTVPHLKADMETLMRSLESKYERIGQVSDKLPAMANNFLTIRSQLAAMVGDPFRIASRMNDLNNALNSLGTWHQSLQHQPLTADYFRIGAPDERWPDRQSGLWQRLRATIANFFVSFRKDYNNVGSVLADDVEVRAAIDVWIAGGMEWAEIVKEMADEAFTPQTGIGINVNVLPANQLQAGDMNALMLSITSGNAPDVGLGVPAGSPVEFAIRDAVYDLAAFGDFADIAARFIPNIMVPYQYRGGVYALPETMDFSVMFYRKDIVQELGIAIPDTREELYSYVLPALYQSGLQFFYPPDFTQFLFQYGGDFYTRDGMRSALDTPEAFRAFQEYTELFTNYAVPVAADFYNRMRSGEMPMGIGTFGTYMQLSVAAPELVGRWGIAPLPGIRRPDGVVDRSNGALAGQSAIILKQSEHPGESWEFLKWWTSAPVQTAFARELEAVIGVEARWNTANLEAFSNLAWKKDDLAVIREQWKWARETPVVLGGYFTGRYVSNAWNTVVLGGGRVRDSLESAVKEINRELRMKQEEYGVFDSQR